MEGKAGLAQKLFLTIRIIRASTVSSITYIYGLCPPKLPNNYEYGCSALNRKHNKLRVARSTAVGIGDSVLPR